MVAVAGRDVGPLEFIWRRAARIYPTYWLAWFVLLSVMLTHTVIHSSGLEVPASLWSSLLLIPQRSTPLLPMSWTLVFEMYFYLVFTILLATGVPLVVGLAAWAVVVGVLPLLMPNDIASFPIWHVVANPMTAEFMMGAVIGLLWRHRCLPGRLITGAVGLGALAISIWYLAPALSLESNPQSDAWRVVLFGVPTALVLYDLTGIELGTRSPAVPMLFVKLGDWSYATYLIHWIVIPMVGKAISLLAPGGGVGASFIFAVSCVVAANAAGAVIHYHFERPTLRRLHRLGMAFRSPRLKTDTLATKTTKSV